MLPISINNKYFFFLFVELMQKLDIFNGVDGGWSRIFNYYSKLIVVQFIYNYIVSLLRFFPDIHNSKKILR